MNPAIFLDRDGVIIENVDTYVRAWSDVAILPGSLEALARLKKSEFKIIVVTNQSVVGRGILTLSEAQLINDRLIAKIVATGGRVDDVFICPHAPSEACACRKPNPGLLLQAAAKHTLDLEKSILVGDALTDLQAGRNAGVGQNILVRTGRGKSQLALPLARQMAPFPVFDRLTDVVEFLYPALL